MKRILTFLFLFSSLFASSQTQYIGAPNTTVVARGNMKVDSILYLPKREKTPTDTGALRYQISDSSLYVWTGSAWLKAKNDGTVTSVGLTMPSAFAVANSPVTTSGTLAVTATGSATEYIRGDGTLGTLPTSGGGGGSGVNYYLNGSVSQGTIGGSTYYEMNKTPVVGTGTNFTAAADGLMQQFITDAGDPNRLLIPAGAWNFELYFSASSAGGTPTFYVELLKYDGTTFTSISSSSASPQAISNGTTKTLYFTSLAVSETVLTATDRLAIRVYVAVSGRTITFYTEDANLAEIITTFAGGVVSLNGLTPNDQFFATGTSGSDFNISSTSATHTFNLPTASATNRGALSSTDWSTFNNKVNISDTAAMLTNYIRHGGYGLTKTGQALSVDTFAIATRSRVQKGIDSVASVRVGGTGTLNYIPKFTGTSTLGNSLLFDNGAGVAIGTTTITYPFQVVGSVAGVYSQHLRNTNAASGAFSFFRISSDNDVDGGILRNSSTNTLFGGANSIGLYQASAFPIHLSTNNTVRQIIHANGRVGINTTSDAGYQLDVAGSLRNTTGANFATSSGNVVIGGTGTGIAKLDVQGGSININTSGQDALLSTRYGANSNGSNLFFGGGGGSSIGAVGETFKGSQNTSFGISSMLDATTAYQNTAVGASALRTTTTGFANSAFGSAALNGNTTGSNNVAIGTDAGRRIASAATNTITNNSIYIGYETKAAADNQTNQTVIGYGAVGNGSNTTTIGNSSTATTFLLGKLDVGSFDSTATGINMLYADANGVIKKAAVPSGGSGTVTSITAGTGLTGGTITTSGTIAVDTASIATRARVQKGIDSVTTLANTKLSGTGISGYFPKWTGTSTQDTSQLFQLGKNIGIGTASPTYRIHLPDAGNTSNQAMIAGSVFGSDGNGQTITPSSGALTYYGQGGVGYLYGAQVSAAGHWGVNTRSLNDATFNVDGSVKIVTVDSTSTARNMLYQDANGVIKKSIALSMADDVMTASGSWVATKDAGSGVTINNVAYTTNGTTKMVTVDGNFYIPSASFSDGTWNEVGTIPAAYRPSKTVNWNSNFIVSGAEYERSDNTDFTGALSWTYGQMRIKDDGKVEVNASVSSNSIAAGGTAYIIITFTQSYIIK